VQVGRIQFFNNWSPALVKEKGQHWIGMEYFTNEGDSFWSMSEADIAKLAVKELHAIRFADPADVIDTTVIRVKKTYPSYTGAYTQFDTIRSFVDTVSNLFLIGRNGMHRYNNQDHSMLTAMVAVDMIIAGDTDKKKLWDINTEKEYHEEKKTT
jgi:protoporphyrinogen oxidase